MDVTGLPTLRVAEIDARAQDGAAWLVEGLWLDRAVGLIGGPPKSWKSWASLDLAVSIASGTPCLGHFKVVQRGPVLVYLAEDSLEEVRRRVEGIAFGRSLDIKSLDVMAITSPILRLDSETDQERLMRTVEELKPKMLLLDPLVRIHSSDENSSRDIARLLGYFREIERLHGTSVILTHHVTKRATSRPGQALRGSGDLHAWGSSNLYLSRRGDLVEVVAEHRSAASPPPIRIKLVTAGKHAWLTITDERPPELTLEERILDQLAKADGPLARPSLRAGLRINNERLGQALASLKAEGRIMQTDDGFVISE